MSLLGTISRFLSASSDSVAAHMEDGSGTPLTSTSSALDVNIKSGGGSGGTSSSYGAAFPGTGTGIGASDGTDMQPLEVESSTNKNLRVGLFNGSTQALITGANALKVDGSAATQPVSGSVTADAGTNLNTSALALETGGNLAAINTKLPVQGQALSADSIPVVLPAAQISTLTPLTSVTANLGTLNGAAQDGTDSTDANATQATAGVGIRGWLSTLTSLFRSGNAKVTLNGTSSISGNVVATQGTGSNLHTVVDSGTVIATQATAANLNATVVGTGAAGTPASGVVSVQGVVSGTAIPVDGTVTANAGTNLNTAALALESGGHLASVDAKLPSQGQALAAASLPVILPSATITTLTPPSNTGYALDASLSTIDTDLKSNVTLHAGTNIIGHVTTDQTTHGLTDLVAADLTKVGGTAISLGTQTAANSLPVALPTATITTLTPPANTGYALDTSLYTIDTDLKSNITLHAGSNIVGKVTTDQTTHGTTDLVAADLTKVGGSALAIGQQVAGASLPVVLPAAQITSLTPLSTVAVTQATGSNLHAVLDSGTTTVTQTTGTNLHTVVDSGSVSISGTPTVNALTGQSSTSAITSVAATTTASTQLLAANSSRKGATFYNNSTNSLYLTLNATSTTSAFGILIAGGGYYEMPTTMVYTGIISGVWNGTNGNVQITQFT